jgi:transcriptional regulator with XRE-family HTH domain
MKTNQLGNFLKVSREKVNLSQFEVSEQFKLNTPQCISNWETGRTSPPMKHLAKLCRLYNIDMNKLFDLLVDYSLEQTKSKMDKEFQKITKRIS